jgi:hypothetical protein
VWVTEVEELLFAKKSLNWWVEGRKKEETGDKAGDGESLYLAGK